MDSISINYERNNRKSSCATVVPPTSKGRKASIPLRINCKDTGTNIFYDTGSMNDLSPTTAVSSKGNSPMYHDLASSTQDQSSVMASIKRIPNLILQKFKGDKNKSKETVTSQEKESEDYRTKKKFGQTDKSSKSSNLDTVIRHSYSDPHLSPGSTAVGCEDDEERNGYFGSVPAKKKKTPRGWIAAILMIVVGALIAVTFVLVGLGKALGGNNSVASAQQHASNSTTIASLTQTVSSSSTTIDQTLATFATIEPSVTKDSSIQTASVIAAVKAVLHTSMQI